ncbi:hypothetical protein GDO86_018075 [Hymenochirus boettgeri]|uniref:Transmembrane and ubiquitin-like domain-containing protein 1 n=1 Tax=Hymenochirus boettgeri TaxID=247094 RepID=A0A8T2IGT8_9PIPI|nr:hypothetical protein GDO86_018075 [Hymenochirus boettgeri]
MALIEGIGDEVTVLFAVVLLFVVLFLAWVSTHTAERVSPSWNNEGSSSNVDPTLTISESSEEPTQSQREVNHIPSDNELVPADSASAGTNNPLGNNESLHVIDGSPAGEVRGNSNYTEYQRETGDAPTLRHRVPSQGTQGQPEEEGGSIRLRLKFLNDTERLVTVQPSDTIREIKRAHFPGQELQVRLIFQGHLLQDDSQTVSSLQLRDGSVLHCHISQHASVPRAVGDQIQAHLNIGNLLVPLLAFILGLLWYCQFQYPQFFTSTASAFLGVLTLLVSVIAFSSYHT